jgi:hypothetical protein
MNEPEVPVEGMLEARDWTARLIKAFSSDLAREYADWNRRQHPESAYDLDQLTVKAASDVLLAAPIVYWDPDIAAAARNGAEETFTDSDWDRSILGSLKIGSPEWWVIGAKLGDSLEMLDYFELTPEPLRWVSLGMLLAIDEDDTVMGLKLIIDTTAIGRAPNVSANDLRMRSMRLIHRGQDSSGVSRRWLAMFHFMRLPFVDSTEHQHSRATRRQAIRENRDLPQIRVVHLRKRESKVMQAEHEHEWHHQWIVRGHWRRQWYPREDSHKPVYVSPYLKGDPNKPLLSRPVVYKVVR